MLYFASHQAIIMVPPNHPKNQQHPWCGGPTPQQLGFLAVSPGSLHRGNELRVGQNCPWTLLRMSMCSHSPVKSHWSVPTVPPTLALCPPTGKWPSRKMATPTSSSEYIPSFSAWKWNAWGLLQSWRKRERENLNLDTKTFILNDGCIRSVLTHLTASPCYYATRRERERERERDLTLNSALTKWQKKYDWFLFQSIPYVSFFVFLFFFVCVWTALKIANSKFMTEKSIKTLKTVI